jgi:drug/metabolite transporter (DMT)-like permease
VIFLGLWSSGFLAIRVGLGGAPPLTFLALRYGLVLLLLAPLLILRRPSWPRGQTLLRLAAIGFIVQFAYFASCYLAVEYGLSPSLLALITALQPIASGILTRHTVEPAERRRLWSGLALGGGGAVLVILARGNAAQLTPAGFAFGLAALATLTAGLLLEKRWNVGGPPLAAASIQYGVGFIASALAAGLLETPHVAWGAPGFLAALLYLTLANSLIALSLLLAMIRHGAAARVSALFFLVPPLAALINHWALGEVIPPLAWPGMALAALGVALAQGVAFPPWRRRRLDRKAAA